MRRESPKLPYILLGLVVIALTALSAPNMESEAPVRQETPEAEDDSKAAKKPYERLPDQTFLTFPEWYLVFSPAELAAYLAKHDPSGFPFLAHVGQYWQSNRAVNKKCKEKGYPFNGEYQSMLIVIGVSMTVEYTVRAIYETLVGRISEMSRRHGRTEEDLFNARYNQAYVDFLAAAPFYDYPYMKEFWDLWKDTSLWGPDLIRKWERKYALSVEFLFKAFYSYLIREGTKASFDPELPKTAVVLSKMSPDIEAKVLTLEVTERPEDGKVAGTLPRYHAFMVEAIKLAREGAEFESIAGNDDDILLTVLLPAEFDSFRTKGCELLFEQPIITQKGRKRWAVVTPIKQLSALLRELDQEGVEIEHIFDF